MKFLIVLVVLIGSSTVHASEKVSVTAVEATCYQGKSLALKSLLERLIVAVNTECETKGANSQYIDIGEELTVDVNPQLASEYCGGVSATLEGTCTR